MALKKRPTPSCEWRRRCCKSRAPSTALRAVPLPRYRGGGCRAPRFAGADTELDRPIGDAAGGSAAGHRARRVCRRYQFPASASHAHRALGACPWPHRGDRRGGGARTARRLRGMDRGRHRRRAADRFPRRLDPGARSLSPAGAGARTACAMSASRSPRSLPPTPISPKMPPISSRWRSKNCRRCSMRMRRRPNSRRAIRAKRR